MKTIYALLVGIDDYPRPVRKLRGCVNDIKETEAYLKARVEPGEGRTLDEALKVRALANGEATRDEVIKAFREHLGQASEGDVALFCYSGHGSQELAPEQFWHTEPDHLNETLVLYDSRTANARDLADKELAKLIGEVAARGPHVVVLLDCCHSGSGTRNFDEGVRRVETDTRPRLLDSFIFTLEELEELGFATRNVADKPSGWNAASKRGRHVLLAACRDDEEAKEYQGEGSHRGAFSYFLGMTLRAIGGTITYRSLFDRTSALVRGQVARQTPQLEATEPADLDQPFLGGVIRPAPRHAVATVLDRRWTVDVGRIHGISESTADDTTIFALFDFKAKDEDLTDPTRAIGRAKVIQVEPASSSIELEGVADPDAGPFKAIILHQPTTKLRVALEEDEAGVCLIQAALNAAGPGGEPSLFVRPTEGQEAPDYRVIAREGRYLIVQPGDDRPLVEPLKGFTRDSARRIVERLEHIERWKATAELQNPNTSIGEGDLEVKVIYRGEELKSREQRFAYHGDDPPRVTIKLKNNSRRPLFVGALDLPDTFGIFSLQPDRNCQKLGAGEETAAHDGESMPVYVPDKFWKLGIGEITDIIKIIVSTREFDVRRLTQEDLEVPDPEREGRATRGMEEKPGTLTQGVREELGTLERLMARVQTRHAGGGAATQIDDWRTLQVTLTTVRPLPARRLVAGQGATLTVGVRIEPHPKLAITEARAASLPTTTRAIGALAPLPRLLYDDPAVVQPFEFAETRAIGGGLNVLELSGVNDPALVTPDDPLRVVIPHPLGPGEHILPVAFDGEFYLPLGRAGSVGGKTEVILERLPQPTEADTRTLGGVLRILFQKVVARTFGTEYRYPILAAAEVDEDFTVRYEPDPAVVRARVAKANRIALFVHGIIGDTREMAASLRRARVADRYDLVLTFDYENLQDPIAEAARALKSRLEGVGLCPDHGKNLDVIAHSMGGLVSRWLIEREEGNRVVRRLIMLGTPNGGSPWPRVQDWATTALAVGLNELSKVIWPASVLAGLIQAVEAVDVTLDQMVPDSGFLKDLHASPDPRVPYLMIAGNTSLIPATIRDEERRSRLRRLLVRLWSDRAKYDLADMFFGGSENDIAVSLVSMRHLAGGREPECEVRTVPCDHVSYFRDPEGLKVLSQLLQ